MRTKRSDLLSRLGFIVTPLALALFSVTVLSQEPKPSTEEEMRGRWIGSPEIRNNIVDNGIWLKYLSESYFADRNL